MGRKMLLCALMLLMLGCARLEIRKATSSEEEGLSILPTVALSLDHRERQGTVHPEHHLPAGSQPRVSHRSPCGLRFGHDETDPPEWLEPYCH